MVEEGALGSTPPVVEEGAPGSTPPVVEEGALAPVSKPRKPRQGDEAVRAARGW
ncbi:MULTISPECIES: hypothetical protein [unclassified Nocardioides]|uniref:hypothetical protein n=1 Tax=unclassified Nocardioides TaxID=2615069 RepID=UPI000A62BDA5|nr:MULTISPECIES: hypothetical protein [unclassified Nocardioides]